MYQWRDLIFCSKSSSDCLPDHRIIFLVEFGCERRCQIVAILKFSDYEWREGLSAPKRLDLYLRYGLELNAMLDQLAAAPGLYPNDRATLLQTHEHWLPIDHSSRHRMSRYKYFADLMQGRAEVQDVLQHGVRELLTADKGFRRFRGIKVTNPFA